MRTHAEYEAEIDRLAAAVDLEAKARQSMAEAAANAIEKLKARDAFLVRLKSALEVYETCDEIVWLDDHTTAVDGIAALLDDPKARGEQALPMDMAS